MKSINKEPLRTKPVKIVIQHDGVWLNAQWFMSLKAARDYLDSLVNQRRYLDCLDDQRREATHEQS